MVKGAVAKGVCMVKGACITKGGGHACQRGVCVAKGDVHGRGGGMHAGETATEAGGMHPTGMHSCIGNNFSRVSLCVCPSVGL